MTAQCNEGAATVEEGKDTLVDQELLTSDPDELRQLAKIAREKGQIDRACNLLGDACEITCNREGTDTCKAMAAVLFDFGDCLLAKEEESLDILNADGGENGSDMDNVLGGGSSTKSAMDRLQEAVDMVKATRERELATGKGADEDAESDVDDLQLAWENLEQCRNCLQLFTEEEMPWDLARRCHSRLGDFLQLQERYPQACEEFEKALEICNKCCPPVDARERAVILLRLGECQRQEDKEKGKKTLLEAKALLEGHQQQHDKNDD
ncbi:hypothetical protein Pmar_PMAR028097, partial [Perkinsus marinus ATCC 50983]